MLCVQDEFWMSELKCEVSIMNSKYILESIIITLRLRLVDLSDYLIVTE